MIEIRNRWTNAVILRDEEAGTLRDAVIRSVANRADLRAADLRDANLSAADLRDADLSAADLSAADLSAADLSAANLSAANLSAADLRAADLSAANLRDANLRAADLRDADLRDADLRDANLSAADLSAADLRAANLSAANLRDADLSAANLSAVDLSAANLRDARNYSGEIAREFTPEEYAQRAKDYQRRWPDVPVVPMLDAAICKIVNSGEGELKMSNWHTCETTHCRAGWAVHLAGEAGWVLEEKRGPEMAGAMIYKASTGRYPDFFASDEAALADICKWGALDQPSQPAQSEVREG